MKLSGIEAFLARHERLLLWSLCALALLRVFLFNAAFPFFNNVDEQAHFDTVVKYSKGDLPRTGSPGFERESAKLIALYSSPEYLNTASNFDSGEIPPPVWRTDPASYSPPLEEQINLRTQWINHEASSPPVYYAVAGAWYNAGKLTGMNGGHLLYWVRFLNIPIFALLFWTARLFLKNICSVDRSMQFSVLLLLSFFPQDAFYSITGDGLSALLGAISLYLLIQTSRADRSPKCHLLTGLTLAATFLVKLSNIPILILSALFTARNVWVDLRAKNMKTRGACHIALIAGCLLPIAIWLGWNLYVLGDLTGSAEKIHSLGWVTKPFLEIGEHPFFKLKGVGYFVSELLKTFWRGEFVWGLQRIASQPMDLFYTASSAVFISCSVLNMLDSKKAARLTVGTSALTLFLWILFIASLSTLYDFGVCWYPSRTQPFFTSGRLILGAFLPFLILYIDGLRVILSRILKNRIQLLPIVLLICIAITYSEFRITHPVIGSCYNWFHLF